MTTIDTPLGKLQGNERDGYLVFRGIRYAQAPVGDLRFRPPLAVEPWSDEYDARHYGPSAPQPARAEGSLLQATPEPTDEDASDEERQRMALRHENAYWRG